MLCICAELDVLCVLYSCFFFFFKQKTAYEMRISDWSSDVCSSDLRRLASSTSEVSMGRTCSSTSAAVSEAALLGGGPPELRTAMSTPPKASDAEIGRASCRERVCQYV